MLNHANTKTVATYQHEQTDDGANARAAVVDALRDLVEQNKVNGDRTNET